MTRRLISLCLAAVSGLLLLSLPSAATAAPARPAEPAQPGAEEPTPPADRARPAEPASPATTAPAEDKAKARELFVKGSKLYQAGQFREAIQVFKKAYTFWKNPRIRLNIAICLLESGQSVEAVTELRATLKEMDQSKRQAFEAKLPAKLVQANKEAAELSVRMPAGDEVAVEIDGKPAGTAPVIAVVMPGKHEVVVRVGTDEKARKTIEVTAGGRQSWELTAWPAATQPTPTPKPKGSGFLARMKKLQRLPIWYFSAAALLAVAGGIATIGTGLKTNKLEDDYFARPSLDTRDEGIRYRNATNAMIGVTVVGVVAAGVLAVFTNWKDPFGRKKERALRLTPQFGPQGGGLAVSGSF